MKKDKKKANFKEVLTHLKKDVKEQKAGIKEDVKLAHEVKEPMKKAGK